MPPSDLPDAEPDALLRSFLEAAAVGLAPPAALYARGEALHQRLDGGPATALPAWGRLLVALGTLAAERLADPGAAGRWYLACLHQAERHRDHEAAVTAGYDLGVLQERRGQAVQARAAYRAAAQEGFRLGAVCAAGLQAAQGAVRLWFAAHGDLDAAHCTLLKQSWLGWLWLRPRQALAPDLEDDLGRTLCAFLLPEEDPAQLAACWRAWPPHQVVTTEGSVGDGDRVVLTGLYEVAAAAADRHLADERADPGGPYRLLGQALARA